MPTITTSSSFTFAMDKRMRVWIRVSDSMCKYSEFRSSLSLPAPVSGPLDKLQSVRIQQRTGHHTTLTPIQGRTPSVRSSIKAMLLHEHHDAETLAHLSVRLKRSIRKSDVLMGVQNQMAAALFLGSGEEYCMWLRAYTRRLVQLGDEVRLNDLCETLLYADPYERISTCLRREPDTQYSGTNKPGETWNPELLVRGRCAHSLVATDLLVGLFEACPCQRNYRHDGCQSRAAAGVPEDKGCA